MSESTEANLEKKEDAPPTRKEGFLFLFLSLGICVFFCYLGLNSRLDNTLILAFYFGFSALSFLSALIWAGLLFPKTAKFTFFSAVFAGVLYIFIQEPLMCLLIWIGLSILGQLQRLNSR